MRRLHAPRLGTRQGIALSFAALFLQAACNLNMMQGSGGVPLTGPPLDGCGPEGCHHGEHCDAETDTCAPGCVRDDDCTAMVCVKGAGSEVGECQPGTPSTPPPPGAAPPPPPAPVSGPVAPPIPELAACPESTKRCKDDDDCLTGSEQCAKGLCVKQQAGCACEYRRTFKHCGLQAHCFEGMCYPDEAPYPCRVGENECGSDAHCTEQRCWPNETGSPCANDRECGLSSACVDGVCN